MAIESRLVAPKMVYIHKETTNQSFIDMHHFLMSKGIQNNDFFLTLLDPALAGVNPRDPNLSTQMKFRVLQECCNNFWYFLREVVTIPESGGAAGGGSRYVLNRGNLAMNFLFVLNFSMFLEMPRQWGKTIGALCRYLWCYNFGTSYSEIMFMHKDHGGSKNNLKKLKEDKEQEAAEAEHQLQVLNKLKDEINNKPINVFIKMGDDGKLFGSITTKQIAEEFEKAYGIHIDKRKI